MTPGAALAESGTGAAPPGAARRGATDRGYYLPELDGLRFLAFLAVFANHSFGPPPAGLGQPWRAMWAVLYGGGLGVDLFFALSGFLITTLLLREEAIAGRASLSGFWIRRILRIWPLYYLALGLGFLVLPRAVPGFLMMAGDQLQMIRTYGLPMAALVGNWAFVANGYTPSPLLSPLWSISVEEQFYLLWPLVLVVAGWRRALLIAGLGVAAAPLFRLAQLALTPAGHLHHPTLWTSSAAHVDVLLLGCLVAIIGERRPSWFRAWTPRVAVLTASISSAVLLFLMARISVLIDVRATATQCLLYSLIALATSVLVGSVVRLPAGPARLLRWRPVVGLGRISYGLYVYHLGVLAMVGTLLGSLSMWVRIPLGFGLTVAAGVASYLVLERPFLRLKRRWTVVSSRPV